MVTEDHRPFSEDLPAFALGALPGDEATRIERHLEGCESCRERLRWLDPAIGALLASVEEVEPPPGLRARLLEAVSGRERLAGPIRRLVLRPAVAFAALGLIAAGLAGYAVRGGGEGARTVAVEGLGAADRASGTLVRHGDEGMLRVSGLPRLPRGEVYEVWLHRNGRVIASTVFVARGDGTATAAIPARLEDSDSVVVTREPSGGTRRPTGAPMLTARL
jgi:anti-sigma-K factor RskA